MAAFNIQEKERRLKDEGTGTSRQVKVNTLRSIDMLETKEGRMDVLISGILLHIFNKNASIFA